MKLFHICLLSASMLTSSVFAQTTKAPVPEGPTPTLAYPEKISDQVWTMQHQDKSYRVFIKVIGQPPEDGYPILYMLDGNALMDTFAQNRLPLPRTPMILVGLGYPVQYRFDFTERAWDYTPPQEDGSPDIDPLKPERHGGGAETFYQWLAHTVKPKIAKEWSINQKKQALYGHSYGGLFAMHALLRHPDAFTDWIIVSPALWRSAPQINHGLAMLAKAPPTNTLNVLFLGGGNEQAGRQAQPERAALSANAPGFETIQQQLGRLPGVHVQTQSIPGKNHGAMIDAGLEAGLQWLQAQ